MAQSSLYAMTDICKRCGTDHIATPRSTARPPPLCRSCSAPLTKATTQHPTDRRGAVLGEGE